MNNGKTRVSKKYSSLFKYFKLLSIIASSLLILFFIIILLPRPTYKDGFRNLSELKEYAGTIDEFIKRENNNSEYPTYDEYYRKNFSYTLKTNLQEKLVYVLSLFGLVRKPIFSASFFKTLLDDVTKERKKRGWVGNFVQKFEATPTSKTIVFGAVQGAFHALIRYLDKLKELGIIDENLKITQPDYTFVFFGNVINRCAYTLEIFSIVLRLMQVNPDNVIYLKNLSEFTDYWRKSTLRQELDIRASHLSGINEATDAFLSTLPMHAYCSIPFALSSSLPYVRFSSYTGDLFKPNELGLVDFLKKQNNVKFESFDISNLSPEKQLYKSGDVELRAVVKDIFKREQYESMDGLRLLRVENNIASWTVLSTAAEIYREWFDFFYDAFVIITPARNLDQWLITLYNRDVRNKDTAFKTRSCYFFSGGDVR